MQETYFKHQEALISGLAEGHKDVEQLLGGLGKEKISELAIERASNLKCGNLICKNTLSSTPYNPNAVVILSNKEVISADEYELFCSESCLLFNKMLIASRPDADVWDREKAYTRQQKQKEKNEPTSGLVKRVTINENVKKPKNKFPTGGILETDNIELEYDNNNNIESNEIKKDEEGDDGEDENEELIGSFLDMSLVPNETIEHSNLSLFAIIYDFLTRIVTDETRRALKSRNVEDFHSSLTEEEEEIVNQRRFQLLSYLSNGLNSLREEEKFEKEAKQEISRLLLTLDLSRKLPELQQNQSTLLTCVFLNVLAENNRFKNHGFENNVVLDSIKTIPSLSEIDLDRLICLKDIFQ